MEKTLIDGRYQLIKELGRGGEAQVFHAHDVTTAAAVAVRLALHPSAAATAPAIPTPNGFHDHWVKWIASGRDAVRGPYQVYEFLDGPSLADMLARGPLEPGQLRAFADESLAAVGALHAGGWIHGDLHAGNFVHSPAGWKLLELPFLRFVPPTSRSALFGNIHTLAPEQIDGAPADIGSDLYALGCLFYVSACGSFPHPGAGNREVAIHCLRFPAEPLHHLAPGLSAAWCDGVMKLIAPKRADRPESAVAARHLLSVAVA